jgi:hypothetical protein
VWKLKYEGGVVTEDSLLVTAPSGVLSFGTDQNNELYVLCNNGIIYRFNQGGATDTGENPPLLPDRFALEQNFPNPFNPETNIRFMLKGSGLTSLKVYDVLGREVETLVNAHVEAGTHQVLFDGANLSSGVYLYRLVTPGFTETKAMLLAK